MTLEFIMDAREACLDAILDCARERRAYSSLYFQEMKACRVEGHVAGFTIH